MEFFLKSPDYVMIGLMLAISAAIGIYFRLTGGRQKTTEEFLMGGHNMSIWPVAFSLMATYMSAATMLGIPAEIYLYGTQFFIWVVTLPIGFVIVAYVMLPVYFNTRSTTVNEYLEKRYGVFMRIIASTLFVIQVILYASVVIYAPALALKAVSGISIWTTTVALAIVCTLYCALGGLKAVLWTDLIQATLMCITMIAVTIKVNNDIGSTTEVFDIAKKGGRLIIFNTSLDFAERYTLLNCIINGISYSISLLGTNQAQVQRMMSVGHLKKAQVALMVSLPLLILFTTTAIYNGIVMYAKYYDCDPILSKTLSSADQIFPYTMLEAFHNFPGLPGIFIAGILSASLSSASSALNSLTTVIMEDFIKPYLVCKCLTESRSAFLAKIIAFVAGALCLLMTYIVANFTGIYEAALVLNSLTIGPLSGTFVLGMITTRTNQIGACIGLFFGLFASCFISFGSYINKIKSPTLVRSIENCTSTSNDSIISSLGSNINLVNQTYAMQNITALNNEEQYTFPLFKISYIWIPCIGMLVSIIIGYIVSLMINLFKEKKKEDIEVISPILQKWYFKDSYLKNRKQKFKVFPARSEAITSSLIRMRPLQSASRFDDSHTKKDVTEAFIT